MLFAVYTHSRVIFPGQVSREYYIYVIYNLIRTVFVTNVSYNGNPETSNLIVNTNIRQIVRRRYGSARTTI